MSIHIYSAKLQPATRFKDAGTDHIYEWGANSCAWCSNCGQRRRLKNCVVQSYYDCLKFWCATGKGCKDPRVIEAKRLREFRNRSQGQKNRRRGK